MVGIPSYAELYDLAYVPNQWQCPKCGFVLCKSTFNVAQGAIGTTEKDRQSEPCPNDGEWLEQVTYKEIATQLEKRLLEELDKNAARSERGG